jgi:hypothetical protein
VRGKKYDVERGLIECDFDELMLRDRRYLRKGMQPMNGRDV